MDCPKQLLNPKKWETLTFPLTYTLEWTVIFLYHKELTGQVSHFARVQLGLGHHSLAFVAVWDCPAEGARSQNVSAKNLDQHLANWLCLILACPVDSLKSLTRHFQLLSNLKQF